MAVDKKQIEKLLNQLPEDLQQEVLDFAEFLVRKTTRPSINGTPFLHAFFGTWDSGDIHSGDNDRIDADIARELTNPHKAK